MISPEDYFYRVLCAVANEVLEKRPKSMDDLPNIPPWNRVRFRKALRKLLGLAAVLSVVGCAVPQMPSQAYSPNSNCDMPGVPHRTDGPGTHAYYVGADYLLCW